MPHPMAGVDGEHHRRGVALPIVIGDGIHAGQHPWRHPEVRGGRLDQHIVVGLVTVTVDLDVGVDVDGLDPVEIDAVLVLLSHPQQATPARRGDLPDLLRCLVTGDSVRLRRHRPRPPPRPTVSQVAWRVVDKKRADRHVAMSYADRMGRCPTHQAKRRPRALRSPPGYRSPRRGRAGRTRKKSSSTTTSATTSSSCGRTRTRSTAAPTSRRTTTRSNRRSWPRSTFRSASWASSRG